VKIHVRTYGCQMNERDTESVVSMLEVKGHETARDEKEADIVIVNTCSVREKAENKALGKLGLMIATKRDRPGRLVGAMGCMVQRLGERILDRVPGLDFAIGTERHHRLGDVIDRVLAGGGPVVEVEEDRELLEHAEELTGHVAGRPSAFVNILFGCNRGCAYCVVPSVRGRERSRSAESVLAEVAGLAEAGVREVTLLGQSVMSYGRTNEAWGGGHASPNGFTEPLARLLEAVAGVEGIERVRFTSGHASGCTDELVRAMAEVPEVCEHLHLPVQSGSDRILKMMRRGYTADDYRAAVARLRQAMPGMGITTDIIVGFPSETEEEFGETRRFMEEMAFDNAFIFKYSPRPGTPASKWEDDVPAEEKMRRNHVLLEDQDRRGLALNGALVGSAVEVMVEGVSLRNSSRWSGRTRSNKIAVFRPENGLASGDMVDVVVEKAMAQTLYGAIRNVDKGE